ncbi:MAG: GSCFA domain-containing protein [Cyclobacteriaceae bacterium]
MFRTELQITPSPSKISYEDHLLSVGSCFARAMGQRMVSNKFKALVNPFGTLYNPASIFRLLHDAVHLNLPDEDSYLQRDGIFYNYKFHSDFSAEDQEGLQAQIEQVLTSTQAQLKKSRWLIITLGTAFCYERKEKQRIVANCHKMPADLFEKRMLDPGEICIRFEQLLPNLLTLNPDIQLIFTVSPVRHFRDTLVMNTVSKASLRLAVDQLMRQYPERISYFPSFELMIDDLRDYRFYGRDMLHPTEVAEDYIWQKFAEAYMDQPTRDITRKWEKLSRALQHRAFQPNSAPHQQFLRKTLEELRQLPEQIDVAQEINNLENQLS